MRTDPLEHRAPPLTLFEDDALLVCVKPRGVLAAADASGAVSMAALLAPRAVYPVHRLDRDVTGVMVFAKTKAAAAWLSGEKAALQKDYLAVTEGVPPQSGGDIGLFAWRLSFRHPDGTERCFTLPEALLPEELRAAFLVN